MSDPLDILWKFAYSPAPVLSQEQVNEFPSPLKDILLSDGYLFKAEDVAEAIRIGGELVEVYRVLFSDEKIEFCYNDEYGRPEKVDPELLTLYNVDFMPLARMLHEGLSCRGNIEEVIAGKLWKVGAAGQQSREVYLARNWGSDAEVQKKIEKVKKSSLIFRIGTRPDEYEPFGEKQIHDLDCLISYADGVIVFDAQSVFDGLKGMAAERSAKTRKKSVPKQDEHRIRAENMLKSWFIYKYENAKRTFHGEGALKPTLNLEFKNQKEFATAAGVTEAALSRMKKTWHADILGLGYIYKELLSALSKTNADFFIDFYNQNKPRLKQIGVEY